MTLESVVNTPVADVNCVSGDSSETWPVRPGANNAVARIWAWRMKDWLRLVASMIVSKMPSFQRLLAWPINTRNCSVPSSAQA